MLWAERTQFSNHVLLPTVLITALSISSLRGRGRFGNPVLSEPHSTCLLSRAESVHFWGDQARRPFGGHTRSSPILPPNRDHSFFALTALARHIVVHSIFGWTDEVDREDPLCRGLLPLPPDWDDPLLRRILVGDRNLMRKGFVSVSSKQQQESVEISPCSCSASVAL